MVLILTVALVLTVHDNSIKPAPTSAPVGEVVAYYENEYQHYAIELLIEQNNIEQWTCLYTLWIRESNWRPKAHNKASGAYGIAQFMPRTWITMGVKKTDDGFKQVEAGLDYIERRWGGNICKALSHSLAKGYY
jgi:membrane-bound lytic murein transglycosylase MltF